MNRAALGLAALAAALVLLPAVAGPYVLSVATLILFFAYTGLYGGPALLWNHYVKNDGATWFVGTQIRAASTRPSSLTCMTVGAFLNMGGKSEPGSRRTTPARLASSSA